MQLIITKNTNIQCFLSIKLSSVTLMLKIPSPAGRVCLMDNGGCSHVCTDEPRGVLCSCPAGYKLSPNGTDCEGVWDKIMTVYLQYWVL